MNIPTQLMMLGAVLKWVYKYMPQAMFSEIQQKHNNIDSGEKKSS